MKVDFHVHSTASDGTVAPSALVESAVKGGISVMALTDHDNCDGAAEFLAAASPAIRLVSGIELSIEAGDGFDRFHLLGLGIDPENAALKRFLSEVLEGRNARNERIFANFRRLGIDIRPEPNGKVLARPHFARWLFEHGYATSVKDAFNRYLAPDAPDETRCYEERLHPEQERAFGVIHGAGGICVMAHPKYWCDRWKAEGVDFAAVERGLAELKEKGLDGVEAFYQANTVDESVRFSQLADRFGFMKTAGSDFHGKTKPTIPLGMEVSEAFISPLLERLCDI